MGRLYRIIFFLTALTPLFAKAQTLDCEQTLALATEEFNAGHFYNVPSVLNDCLPKFNRDQRQRANLLLTQTYLLLDDPISTQRSFLEVLRANPEFVPDEQLHAIDIVYLSKRFTATPKFSWYVGIGSNVSPVSLIRDLYVSKPDQDDSYRLRPGYNFGAGGEYSFDDNLKLRVEANFHQTSYAMNAARFNENDVSEFIDRQTWLNIPLHVVYSDNIGTYRPYGYAGYSVSKLLSDKASVSGYEEDQGEGAISSPWQSKDYDFRNRRSQLNHSIIFGAGIKYKIGLDFVFVDVRYSAGLKNFIDADYSLADPTLAGKDSADPDPSMPQYVESFSPTSGFVHRDNFIRLNNCALTIGFLRPLYKPRELKRARTKGVLRKLKRAK